MAAALALSTSSRAASAREAIAVTARVPTFAGPTGLGYGHGLLWVTRDNNTVARVDPRSGRVLGRTHVGRFPVRVAVGGRWAWVANSGGDSVSKLDARTGRRLKTIAVGDQPSGVALVAGSVWVVCGGDTRMFRIDPITARVVATIAIGEPPNDPPAIAAGPTGLWTTRLDQVVQISPRRNAVAASVHVRAPTDVAVGPDRVWIASIEQHRVTRIDPRSKAVDRSVQVGHGPSGVTYHPGVAAIVNKFGRDWLSMLLQQDPKDIKDFSDQIGAHPESISALHRKLKRLEKFDFLQEKVHEDAVYKIQPVSGV